MPAFPINNNNFVLTISRWPIFEMIALNISTIEEILINIKIYIILKISATQPFVPVIFQAVQYYDLNTLRSSNMSILIIMITLSITNLLKKWIYIAYKQQNIKNRLQQLITKLKYLIDSIVFALFLLIAKTKRIFAKLLSLFKTNCKNIIF